MRIAVCDDEKAYLEKIADLVRDYSRTRQGLSFSLSASSSANELLDFINEHGGFDLYILDIIMPEVNSIQLGPALRSYGEGGMFLFPMKDFPCRRKTDRGSAPAPLWLSVKRMTPFTALRQKTGGSR